MPSSDTRETFVSANTNRSIVVVGAGGNIGSHLTTHLGRMPGVAKVTLIDRDEYVPHNLANQNVLRRDLGHRKAHVQARRLRRIDPRLEVEALHDSVENIPLGRLRCDVLLACLDSRSARQYVNEVARHLGIPWIDSGVDGEGLLARVAVYLPGSDHACIECGWSQPDYDALEQVYPCTTFREPPPTNASAALGGLAASMLGVESQKLLRGDRAENSSRQVLLSMQHDTYFATRLVRNPSCRLAAHDTWSIQPLVGSPRELTLSDAFGVGAAAGIAVERCALRIQGKSFARKLCCPGCGRIRSTLRLHDRIGGAQRTCSHCRSRMLTGSLELSDSLMHRRLQGRELCRSLQSLGLRDRDVVSIECDGEEVHLEITRAA